ncbi:MAG: phosphonopyruvate decarboxylase [Gammaproteobacteria bacterium]|nr:phosphonopyruvate decarboxylase [Gammaproteobacteria bacterium]
MINTEYFFKNLLEENVEFFAGVPDSLLKNICSYITDNTSPKNHIIAANEGNALALGIGYHLASGKLPLIYMQNSGLGNVVNPLLSLADPDVYSVPMLLMIGWRGEPNVKDEPQHKKQGRVTLQMLEAMEVPYQVLSKDTSNEQAKEIIKRVSKEALKNNAPYAIVVKKGTFSEYKLQKDEVANLPLFREDAIKVIVDNLDDKDIVVSTTGVASRELFEYREELIQGHEKDFLTVGGMGHANQIALGIALQKPDRSVFCLDGDGAALMHMGSMAINGNVECDNFKHIVFNNGAHDSVGGQPTVGYTTGFQSIAKASGYDLVLQAETKTEVVECIEDLKGFTGKVFLEIKVKKGFRKDLGRPTTTPKENKQNLMKFIKEK